MMRIIALPIARLKIPRDPKINQCTDFNASNMLIYYHFDLISSSGGNQDLSWHQKSLKGLKDKAADLWTSLGQAPKGSWKLWTYGLGERIADRIDFEESALRGVDPSMGPAVSSTGPPSKHAHDSHFSHSFPKIPLIYPPSLYPGFLTAGANCAAFAHLQTLLSTRGPRHRKGFYLWMLLAPFTLPIALIPVIPNLPLFFCVWRSWSHYRAYKATQYLSSLLDRQLIEPDPSIELDKLYTSSKSLSAPIPSSSGSSDDQLATGDGATDRKSDTASGMGEPLPKRVLLTHEAVPHILAMFRLPESAAVNMYRAVDQARGRQGASS